MTAAAKPAPKTEAKAEAPAKAAPTFNEFDITVGSQEVGDFLHAAVSEYIGNHSDRAARLLAGEMTQGLNPQPDQDKAEGQRLTGQIEAARLLLEKFEEENPDFYAPQEDDVEGHAEAVQSRMAGSNKV